MNLDRVLGQDLLSRIIYGARISLTIGIVSVALGLFFGAPLGAISGYYGGKTDLIVQRVIDIMLAFPGILLAIVVVSTLGVGLRQRNDRRRDSPYPDLRAFGPGICSLNQRTGIHLISHGPWHKRLAHYLPAYPAQLPRADNCAVHHADCHGHPLGHQTWLSGIGGTPPPLPINPSGPAAGSASRRDDR